MKCVGIDIGTYSIKLAEVEAVGSASYQFNHFEEFALPHSPGADPAVDIIEILRKISGRYDPTQTRFIVGVRQENVSLRRRQFPFRERQKILKILPFDLEDELPFNQDDVVIDAKVQHYTGALTQVLAVACPKEQVQRILSICKDGLIDPDIISTEGFALGNMIEDWMSAPPEVSAPLDVENASRRKARILLHLGHTRTLVAVFDDQEMLSVRTIFWGGRNIIDAISKRFEVPYGEAVQALESKGFILLNKEGATKDQVVFSDTIANACEPLFQSLKLTLLSLESNENLNIEQIQVTGLVSKVRNFNAFLTQHLERRTNPFDPCTRFSQVRFAVTPEVSATGAIAFGLAAEGLKRPRNPATNLRRAELGKASDTAQKTWEKWRHTALLVTLAYVAFFTYSLVRLSFAQDLNLVADNTLATIGQQTNGLNSKKRLDIQRFIKNRQKQIRNKSIIEKLQAITSPLDLVNQLSREVPTKERIKLDISELVVRDNYVHIKGSVSDKNETQALQTALKKLSLKAKAPEVLPPAAAAKGAAFAYRIEVNRLGGKE